MDKQKWDEMVTEYVALFRDLRNRFGDERIALGILHEVNKDIRMAQIREERANGIAMVDYPATERQKLYLAKLGIEIPAKLTKKEASALIDQELENDPD